MIRLNGKEATAYNWFNSHETAVSEWTCRGGIFDQLSRLEKYTAGTGITMVSVATQSSPLGEILKEKQSTKKHEFD